MKESRAYIKFFKDNFTFLIYPLIFSLLVALYINISTSPIYQLDRVVELEYKNENINNINALTDELVFLLRSKNVHSNLNISPLTSVSIYKGGPAAIKIEVISVNEQKLHEEVTKIQNYIDSKSKNQIIPQDIINSKSSDSIFTSLFIISAGIAAGLIFTLIKAYFKHY